jgi:hypothetical protein
MEDYYADGCDVCVCVCVCSSISSLVLLTLTSNNDDTKLQLRQAMNESGFLQIIRDYKNLSSLYHRLLLLLLL